MSNFLRHCFIALIILSLPAFAAAQGGGGFYIQHRINSNKTVFIPTGTKVHVSLRNGKQVKGHLSEADSLGLNIDGNDGKPVRIDYYSLAKLKVYNKQEYFKLTKRMGSSGTGAGCAFYNGCDLFSLLVIAAAYTVVAAGELVIDGIADISNDITYDMKNVWKVQSTAYPDH